MEGVRKLESSLSIAQSTLYNGVYNEVAYKPEPNWGTLLSEYSLSFKQLNSVWEDIDPVFQLYELVPSKPTQIPSEIPSLLCTTIQSEDKESVIEPDLSLLSSHEEIETLISHNITMKRFLSSYSEKTSQIIKSKKQKLNFQTIQISNEKIQQELSQFR